MKIILGTHGKLGEQLVNSAEMILGKLEGVECASLMPGMSFEDFIAEAEEKVKACGDEDVIVLVDLFGGTPSNVFSALTRKYPIHVVTGANLPALISLYSSRDAGESVEQLVDETVEAIRESAVHTNERLGN